MVSMVYLWSAVEPVDDKASRVDLAWSSSSATSASRNETAVCKHLRTYGDVSCR